MEFSLHVILNIKDSISKGPEEEFNLFVDFKLPYAAQQREDVRGISFS